MEPHHPTTPFGRRSLTLAHVASQATAKTCPPDKAIHKWQVFRDICAAKAKLGVSDRALAVLSALLSFHPETVLKGPGLIVFPSNRQLGLRAHGMAPATLRRHLAALVEGGLILRRDSPNGKRYARKTRAGEIETAFGFDLTPLVARAEVYAGLAEEMRRDERAARRLKEHITLLRRDVAKTIASGLENGVEAPWEAIHAAYKRIVARTKEEPQAVAEELKRLADDLFNLLESHAKKQKPSADADQGERHIQNSNPESIVELEPSPEKPTGPLPAYPLGMVLKACPDIADYARGGVRNWGDLVATASVVVRPMLGISPSAWTAARAAMGDIPAAIAVAAILQRAPAISSAGGYLRELTKRAGQGRFSVGPMLMALLKASAAPAQARVRL